MNFGQVITAMVTPFNQSGAVDVGATKDLVDYLIDNGSDALVIGGTTGESPTLTTEEKVRLFSQVVDVADGRIPVIAGTGSNSTHASIQLTKQAEQAGVDAIMLVAPYYNKPTQEGLFQHFQAIAQATSLPVMLYNIPGRSVVNMTPATIARLSEIDNIVSVKEASGDLEAMTEIISRTPAEFTVYCGEDGLTLPALAIGATGIVSVSSHVLGNEMQQLVTSYSSGDVARASTIHRNLLPKMKAIFSMPSPAPVKAALNAKGMRVGSVRLPLLSLTEEETKALNAILSAHPLHELVG